MGKSVDLPDPLESAASRPLGNADDLLAQLAGEEVDRLLAEADAEGPRQAKAGESRRAADATPADLSAAVTGPPPETNAIQNQLDALFTEFTGSQPGAEPESEPEDEPEAPARPASAREGATPIAPEPFTALRSKLPDDINTDEVLAAILGEGPTATAPFPTPAAANPMLPAPPVPAPAKSTALATTTAERQALTRHDPADELPGPGELEALAGPIHVDDDDAPLPAYLRPIVKPLEWMNAPLDLLPTTLRDVLGQIAILTLVNAIAVLIYVFVFRTR